MQVVWMARMEKQVEGESLRSGLLSAGEEAGKWIVLWEPDEAVGHDEAQQAADVDTSGTWYEGSVWMEMRAALRGGVARLLREGYQPALGFMPDTNLHERRMKERNEWISCYGELHSDDKLYERLAQWRRETASSLRRAPYWIATNRMLRLVSAFVPHNAEELRQLPGFGEAKVKSFADAITAITKTVERSTSFPLDWVEGAVTETAFVQWVYEQERTKMDAELSRLMQRRVLLEGVRDGLGAGELMERLEVDRRELLMRIETLAEEGYDVLSFVNIELADTPEEELLAIRNALTELGPEYLKPVFVRIYGEEALTGTGSELQRRYERIRLLRLTMDSAASGQSSRTSRKRASNQQSA
ncbi:HRDC domain-containing protein [Paenibacillus marinisediminis]